MKYLHENDINGYIPRDPKFKDHKINHPRKYRAKKGSTTIFPAEECTFDKDTLSCTCPNGEKLIHSGNLKDPKIKLHENLVATINLNGKGRQVSFLLNKQAQPYRLYERTCRQ